MSSVMENILTRRSVRAFKSDEVPAQLLDQIIEAGLYAPTGMGQQDTVFICVTRKELRDEISRRNREIGGWKDPAFDPFYGAPALIIVLADADRPTRVYDGSLALGNMMLAAHDLGLGSVWIHRAKEEFESEWGRGLLKQLGITGNYEGIGHLAVGFPEGELPKAAPRKPGRVFRVE